ncbi:hypothetical protein COOONC_10065 [Cooperia oncophora]
MGQQFADQLSPGQQASTLPMIAKKFGWEDDYYSGTLSKWQQIKPRIWALFDEPWSSQYARIISCCSVFFILASTISFMLKTHPSFQIPQITVTYGFRLFEKDGMSDFAKAIGTHKPYTAPHPYFFYVDLICNSWFTLELLIRLLFCPSMRRFLRSPLTIVDASAEELALLVFFVLLAIVIFAALVYYAERSQPNPENQFTSIPSGLWWSLITISTVGFGDMVSTVSTSIYIFPMSHLCYV